MNYQDNPFQKNLELWQQFGDTYMQNMFATLQKNLEQSRAFQEQVQTAVSQVVNSQFDMVMTGLKAVEGQIAELTRSFNELVQVQPDGSKTSKKG